MIKNIVFDFGQVLVRFDPDYMTGKYIEAKDDLRLVSDIVFDRLYWDKLDSGDITDDQVVEAVKKRLPERLWEAAEKIYRNWIYNIPEIEGMREIVERLYNNPDINLFLLSNISKGFAEHKNEIPILKYFDNCIFSAVCGHTKPNRDIYEYLCDTYSLTPCETLFIDDNVNNINGAKEFGINGYLFDGDVSKLNEYIERVTK